MFDVDEFVAACRGALEEHTPELAVKELLNSAVARPGEIEAALGTPEDGGISTLHRSDELTIINVIWPPGMTIYPHDHQLWAVIGLYGGQEDNTFFRRNRDGQGLERAGFRELQSQETPLTSAAMPSTPSTTRGRCTPAPSTSMAETSSPSPAASGPTSPRPKPPTAWRAQCAPSPRPTSAGSPSSNSLQPLAFGTRSSHCWLRMSGFRIAGFTVWPP